jgi:hypothetical protein
LNASATSDVVIEPYNAMFALKSIIDSSHADLVIENSSLNRICQNLLKVNQPTFADINYITA